MISKVLQQAADRYSELTKLFQQPHTSDDELHRSGQWDALELEQRSLLHEIRKHGYDLCLDMGMRWLLMPYTPEDLVKRGILVAYNMACVALEGRDETFTVWWFLTTQGVQATGLALSQADAIRQLRRSLAPLW